MSVRVDLQEHAFGVKWKRNARAEAAAPIMQVCSEALCCSSVPIACDCSASCKLHRQVSHADLSTQPAAIETLP